MTAADLIEELVRIAPPALAEPWDNVGLITGDPSEAVSNVLLTIDYTAAVAAEARALGCEFVIAYHPPLFKPVKRVTAGLIHDSIRDRIAIYSPHTALDVVDGGTNDVLADAIGMTDRRPLKLDSSQDAYLKLVTFAPPDVVDRVADALFEAGAGRIGKYSKCSFRSPGRGTFEGDPDSSPAAGSAGQFERVDEIRLETLIPESAVERCVAALKKAHPYEKPAFDLLRLAGMPSTAGIGRAGAVSGTASSIIDRLKQVLGLDHVLFAGEDRAVRTAAVCAGSCGDFLDDAIAAGVDLFVTGEMRHHDALKAVAAGVAVVCLLHSNSERAVLTRLRDRLTSALPGATYYLARTDRDPFAFR